MTPSWAAAAALTFAASIHCVGMCGGFVLALSAPGRGARLRRLLDQVTLQVGKAASYAFLGALGGAFGAAFLSSAAVTWGGRALALLAGLAIVAAGLTLLGLRARAGSDWLAARVAPLWSQWLGPVLRQRPSGASLVIGMAMGFLPCPLVYAGLAAAVATGSAAAGALTLAGVALGTVPALTATALFGQALPLGARRTLARAGGVLLLAVGLVTAWRGLGAHEHHGHAGAAAGAAALPAGHGGHSLPAAPAATAEPSVAPDHLHHH
jgi:sulfite exporter TauE/SafE